MGDPIFCTLCLGTDVKMFIMNPKMCMTYCDLVKSEVRNMHLISCMHACYECAYLLSKYERFKEKCCKAYNILKCYTGSQVTKEKLKNIDRKKNSLESRLTVTNNCYNVEDVEPKYTNNRYIYHKSGPRTVSEEQNKEEPLNDDVLELEIKNETHYIEVEYDNTHKESNDTVKCEFSDYNAIVLNELKNEVDVKDCGNENDSDSDNNANRRNSDYSKKLNDIVSRRDNSDEKIDIKPQKRKLQSNAGKAKTPTKRKKLNDQQTKAKGVNDKFKRSNQTVTTSQSVSKKRPSREKFNKSFFDNYATIVKLNYKEAREEVVLRMESRNYKMSKYKCELCFRGFGLKNTFDTHMKKHSEAGGPLECDACHFRFNTKKAIKDHIATCHKNKFVCQICPKVIFSSSQAKSHVLLHKGKKYECKICGEKFRFPNSVFSHHRMKHKLEVVCDLCGNAFAAERGLESHKCLVHKNEKNEYQGPKCEECNVHFTNDTAYRRHLVLSSKHAVSHGCSVCGESFPNAKSLKEHTLTHEKHDMAKYQRTKQEANDPDSPPLGPCVYCGALLTNNREYSKHMLRDHRDSDIAKEIKNKRKLKCVCEVCGMMFKTKSFLVQHQRTHTGEKPYSCDVCARRFTCLNTLQGHKKSLHSDVLMYKCHICDKRFGHKPNLIKHIKYHSSERPYKCTMCDKRFLFLCEMKYHENYVHNKVPWPKRDRSKRNT